MKSGRYSAGALVSLFAGVLGVVGTFMIFIKDYHFLIEAELSAGRPDEAFIVTVVAPLLSDLMILGGMLWLVASLGFLSRAKWAWTMATLGSVVSLASSFFLMVPAMSRAVFPSYGYIFLPNLVFFFILFGYVNPVGSKTLTFGFFSGIACVLAFMNGVACIDKIMVTGHPMYIPAQQMNWVAAVAWGVFTAALMLKKTWVYPIGVGAGLMAFLAGLPLAAVDTIRTGQLSLFVPAPAVSLVLVVVLLLPFGKKLVSE